MNKLLLTFATIATKIQRQQHTRNLILPSLLASAILVSGLPAYAQNIGEQQWFEIEVIVFKRQQDSYQEHWPKNITLEYPNKWVALQDPEAPDNATPTDPAPLAAEPAASEAIAPADGTDKLANTPFLMLPTAEHKLAAHATALRRNSRYQVLFHHAWRQPLLAPRAASAVLINGGETYDHHQELEGSITFSLSQFLQVKANLWLTEFQLVDGQPLSDWPALPPMPAPVTPEPGASIMLSGEPEPLAETNTLFAYEVAEVYQPARIVLLQEERRIRARELHYLDHPLFGVIFQLTPYELTAPTE